MQEVFIVVWKDAAKYDPAAGSPTGWLMTIAHRRAVDKVRQYQSGANRDARWAAATHTVPYDEVAEAVTDRIDTRLLMESLAGLSAPQRESITMAYFGSLTYKEVAQTLSIPLPTVKSRVREGLNRLRVQLEPA
jgi:RNA polymerase sigma-70 factor (ECF subfamily)